MTAADARPSPPPYLGGNAHDAALLVLRILEGDRQPPLPEHGEKAQHAMAAFLGQLMFAVQLGAGADPRGARDLLRDPGRGPSLARQFLAEGTCEICCDYCGSLMVANLAAAAAEQMIALHSADAPAAWRALMQVIFPGPSEAQLQPLEPRPYVP